MLEPYRTHQRKNCSDLEKHGTKNALIERLIKMFMGRLMSNAWVTTDGLNQVPDDNWDREVDRSYDSDKKLKRKPMYQHHFGEKKHKAEKSGRNWKNSCQILIALYGFTWAINGNTLARENLSLRKESWLFQKHSARKQWHLHIVVMKRTLWGLRRLLRKQ